LTATHDAGRDPFPTALFVVVLVFWMLEELAKIRLSNTPEMYVWDYVHRLLTLSAIFAYAPLRRLALATPGAVASVPVSVLACLMTLLACRPVSVKLAEWMSAWSPDAELYRWAQISDLALYWFDLSIGLVLVAYSEELIFRKLMWESLRRRVSGPLLPALISAGVFSLAHWATGVDNMAFNFISGLAFWAAYRLTGRLSVPVAAHYLSGLYGFYLGPDAMMYPVVS